MSTDLERELAIRVVNLRRALKTANELLAEHDTIRVGCDELQRPSFRGGRKFHAEVRSLTKE